MRIFKLTNLVLDLTAALESGNAAVTNDELLKAIADGTIFEFLSQRLGFNFSGAIYVLDPVDRLELNLEWDNLIRRWEPLEGAHKGDGLWFLISCLMEGIASRAESPDYRLSPEACGAALSPEEFHRRQLK